MTFEEAYQQIRKHHYEILNERESVSKSARLSLSTWVLDILTECREAEHGCKTEPQIIACPINERAEYWFYEDEPQTERSSE